MRKYIKKIIKPELREVDKSLFDKLLKIACIIKPPKK